MDLPEQKQTAPSGSGECDSCSTFAQTASSAFLCAYTVSAYLSLERACLHVYIKCVWRGQATHLRLGSEGMPLDKGRGDGGGGGGVALSGSGGL